MRKAIWPRSKRFEKRNYFQTIIFVDNGLVAIDEFSYDTFVHYELLWCYVKLETCYEIEFSVKNHYKRISLGNRVTQILKFWLAYA